MQDQQEREGEHGDQLADEAEGGDGHLLERPREMAERLWEVARVFDQLGGDVIAVVVMAEGRVDTQVARILRRVP